ncbi:MAG: DUF2520 domain-containing protein [Bacteroidota bacterium]|nr:DUF2520 domain-containing protein [Bacteroidota bacterium]
MSKHDISVSIFGAGKLGTALAVELYNKGITIQQVFSKTKSHADYLANQVNARSISELSLISQDSHIAILSIRDDAILDFSNQLGNYLPKDIIIAHTSGTRSVNEISSDFLNRGLFYPLQSFSGQKDILWSEIPILLDGNQFVTETLAVLASKISNSYLKIEESQRVALHFAAVLVNNFTNFNFILAEEIVHTQKLPFHLLEPLVKETVRKAFLNSPSQNQTGPAVRNDIQTIQKHEQYLSDHHKEFLEYYKLITKQIINHFKK